MSDHTVEGESHELAHHPTEKKYVGVAIFLAIITAIEVALYYVKDFTGKPLVFTLFVLSGIKFVAVAGWFMHLKFDSRVFRRFFITGLVLAVIVFMIVLVLFFYADNGATPAAT